jgi:hypothetical protein
MQAFLRNAGVIEDVRLVVSRRNGLGHLQRLTEIGAPLPGQTLGAWIDQLFGGGRYSITCHVAGGKKHETIELLLPGPPRRPPAGGWDALADSIYLDEEAQIAAAAPAPAAAPRGDDWRALKLVFGTIGMIKDHDASLIRTMAEAYAKVPAPTQPPVPATQASRDAFDNLGAVLRKKAADRFLAGILGNDDDDDDDEPAPDKSDDEGEDFIGDLLKPASKVLGEEFAEYLRAREPKGEPSPSQSTNEKGEPTYTAEEALPIAVRRMQAAEAKAAKYKRIAQRLRRGGPAPAPAPAAAATDDEPEGSAGE